MMVTEQVIRKLKEPIPETEDLQTFLRIARLAFKDYLSCCSFALSIPHNQVFLKSQSLESENVNVVLSTVKTSAERAALINGYLGHFEDLDDVQANLRGHPSAVIFSSLLAVSNQQDHLKDLYVAYIQGLELAARIGEQAHPQHVKEGWHSTVTLGSLGAAAAIGCLKKMNVKAFSYLLSLASSQASGFLFQEGTDGKPLQAGFAARNAVLAYQLSISGLTAYEDIFSEGESGWFQTILRRPLDNQRLLDRWLKPAQIQSPGLWFKQLPFCSAAISAYDAAVKAYASGVRISEIKEIYLHFTEDGDKALTNRMPKTGTEGKFSAEYIIWLALSKGKADRSDFDRNSVTESFTHFQKKVKRLNDLKAIPSQRPAVLELVLSNQTRELFKVDNPKGSPGNPFTEDDLKAKFLASGLNKRQWELLDDDDLTVESFLNHLRKGEKNFASIKRKSGG